MTLLVLKIILMSTCILVADKLERKYLKTCCSFVKMSRCYVIGLGISVLCVCVYACGVCVRVLALIYLKTSMRAKTQ